MQKISIKYKISDKQSKQKTFIHFFQKKVTRLSLEFYSLSHHSTTVKNKIKTKNKTMVYCRMPSVLAQNPIP